MSENEVSYDTILTLLVMQYGDQVGESWTARIYDQTIEAFKNGEGDISMILDRDEAAASVNITVKVDNDED